MTLLKITISNDDDDDDDDGLKDPTLHYYHCSRKGNDVYTLLACCTIW